MFGNEIFFDLIQGFKIEDKLFHDSPEPSSKRSFPLSKTKRENRSCKCGPPLSATWFLPFVRFPMYSIVTGVVGSVEDMMYYTTIQIVPFSS